MRKGEILKILKQIYDPDYRDKSILDMGLVNEDDIRISGDRIEIMYHLTAPLCPFGAAIGIMIRYVLKKKLGKKVEVKIKPGHYQENAVNAILQDEDKSKNYLESWNNTACWNSVSTGRVRKFFNSTLNPFEI